MPHDEAKHIICRSFVIKRNGTLDRPNVQNSQHRTEDSTAAGDDDSDVTTPDTKLRHPVK